MHPTDNWIVPEPSAVVAALEAEVAPKDLLIDLREDRFVAFLPDGRMAWFAMNSLGWKRLQREARVLAAISEHCRFLVPRTVEIGASWQVREAVQGLVEPWDTYRRVIADPTFAESLGTQIGAILADQHRPVIAEALVDMLPQRPQWPYPIEHVETGLRQVLSDAGLIAQYLEVVRRYEDTVADVRHPVVTHGDLGLHNMALSTLGMVTGVFDYDDAALTDHHADFRYLMFDSNHDTLLEAAIASYRSDGGRDVDLGRVGLFNAASAIGFLADRAGTLPADRPAGRTLDEDMRWTRQALGRLR